MKLWTTYAYHRTRAGVAAVVVLGGHDELAARPLAEELAASSGETLRPEQGERGRWGGRPDGMAYLIFEIAG